MRTSILLLSLLALAGCKQDTSTQAVITATDACRHFGGLKSISVNNDNTDGPIQEVVASCNGKPDSYGTDIVVTQHIDTRPPATAASAPASGASQ